MKCAEILLPQADGTFRSNCLRQSSVGVGLLVDTSKTPLYRAYNYDSYTNNRTHNIPMGKPERLYSLASVNRYDSDLVYVTRYDEVASMLQKFHVEKRMWTEATIGDGRNPVRYKAVVAKRNCPQAEQTANIFASVLNLPIIWIDGKNINLS